MAYEPNKTILFPMSNELIERLCYHNPSLQTINNLHTILLYAQ